MMRLGLQKITNKKQAIRIRDDCMQDLKDRLICQANIIKESFQKVSVTEYATWFIWHTNKFLSSHV